MKKIISYKKPVLKIILLTLSFSTLSCSVHYQDFEKNKDNISVRFREKNVMNENEKLIYNFYNAFKNGDAEEMVSYYHDAVTFEDPAFGKLEGKRAKYMWRMLIERGKGNLKLHFGDIKADENSGTAYWDAKYKFDLTGRNVHNKVHANFTFKDGKIFTHKDDFDLHTWSGQALGLVGGIFGGTGFFKSKLNEETNKQLDQYIADKEEK